MAAVLAAESIQHELAEHGYSVVRGGLALSDYRELAASVGFPLGEELIALRPGAHAYVAKPGRVPLHTDHPQVEVIAWLCEEQDAAAGASLLLDARPVLQALAESDLEALRRVELICPPLAGGPPTLRWPVIRRTPSGDALFCSPWLRAASDEGNHQAVLDRLRNSLSAAAREHAVSIRLDAGEALFVDNTRVLHGRAPIADGSARRLRRLWLAAGAASPSLPGPRGGLPWASA